MKLWKTNFVMLTLCNIFSEFFSSHVKKKLMCSKTWMVFSHWEVVFKRIYICIFKSFLYKYFSMSLYCILSLKHLLSLIIVCFCPFLFLLIFFTRLFYFSLYIPLSISLHCELSIFLLPLIFFLFHLVVSISYSVSFHHYFYVSISSGLFLLHRGVSSNCPPLIFLSSFLVSFLFDCLFLSYPLLSSKHSLPLWSIWGVIRRHSLTIRWHNSFKFASCVP